MNPSAEQVKSALRTLIAAGGGALGGWAVAKGYVSQAQVNDVLSNQQFMDAATTIALWAAGSGAAVIAGVWGMIAHKQANVVATVAAMPEVSEVKTTATPAGVALAAAVPPALGSLVTVSMH
jgi:hypothetical protein